VKFLQLQHFEHREKILKSYFRFDYRYIDFSYQVNMIISIFYFYFSNFDFLSALYPPSQPLRRGKDIPNTDPPSRASDSWTQPAAGEQQGASPPHLSLLVYEETSVDMAALSEARTLHS
jgi:hypothetical protein